MVGGHGDDDEGEGEQRGVGMEVNFEPWRRLKPSSQLSFANPSHPTTLRIHDVTTFSPGRPITFGRSNRQSSEASVYLRHACAMHDEAAYRHNPIGLISIPNRDTDNDAVFTSNSRHRQNSRISISKPSLPISTPTKIPAVQIRIVAH